MVLHRHELRPAALARDRLRLRELPRVHAARADVARLARRARRRAAPPSSRRSASPDRSGGSGTGRRSRGRAAASDASIDARTCLRPRPRPFSPGIVLPCTFVATTYSSRVPNSSRQHAPGDHLALAAVVDVGGVEEDDAALDRAPDDRLGLVLAERPAPLLAGPEAHHPEADDARRASRCGRGSRSARRDTRRYACLDRTHGSPRLAGRGRLPREAARLAARQPPGRAAAPSGAARSTTPATRG